MKGRLQAMEQSLLFNHVAALFVTLDFVIIMHAMLFIKFQNHPGYSVCLSGDFLLIFAVLRCS
jgi:hypothetical protein